MCGPVLVAALSGELALDIFFRLVIGWAVFLARVVPGITVDWGGVATGLIALVLFAFGLHRFLRWFYGAMPRGHDPAEESVRRWKPRWTGAIVGCVVVMFVAGIAATGIVHQAGWLLDSRQPLVVPRIAPPYETVSSVGSTNNLKMIGLAAQEYAGAYGTLPGGKFNDDGPIQQSWQTQILTYLPITVGGEIHADRPWNDPWNSAYFKGVITCFLNPEIGALRDRDGYALSHYAGNVHVLRHKRPLRLDELTQGTSQTMLAGEVASEFKPWGDPENVRDPLEGIGRSPAGFSAPSGDGANIVFADGSVRFMRTTVEPEVLRRLSRPDRP